MTVDDIKNLTFTYKDNDGSEKEIPLSDICTISQEQTLSTIHRDAQTRYITGEGFLRISYAYSLDDLKEALGRIEEFVTELRAGMDNK